MATPATQEAIKHAKAYESWQRTRLSAKYSGFGGALILLILGVYAGVTRGATWILYIAIPAFFLLLMVGAIVSARSLARTPWWWRPLFRADTSMFPKAWQKVAAGSSVVTFVAAILVSLSISQEGGFAIIIGSILLLGSAAGLLRLRAAVWAAWVIFAILGSVMVPSSPPELWYVSTGLALGVDATIGLAAPRRWFGLVSA